MNHVETQLVESVTYNYLNSRPQPQPFVSDTTGVATPQPPVAPANPDEIVTQLNDMFKTYLRFKCEAKYIAGTQPIYYVNYKDSYKNPHTFYFQVY